VHTLSTKLTTLLLPFPIADAAMKGLCGFFGSSQ